MPCAHAGSKPWYRCGYTDGTPCRLGDAGSMTFSPWFVPRTKRSVQLHEVGPDRRHLLTESDSDVHLYVCRCRTGDADCCCCSVGSRRHYITACTGVIVECVAGACIPAAPGVAAARTCCCCCCCCCGRCSSTRRWWVTGSHPTESLVEKKCASSGCWLSCVSHGPKGAVPRNPDGKQTSKKQQLTSKKSRQRMIMPLLARQNTWAGPSAGQSNPRPGPRNCRAGPYRARVSWASLSCDGPGRAGP